MNNLLHHHHLLWRDAVELWHQPYPVLLFDEDALQSLLVLLDLDQQTEFPPAWV